MRLKPPPCLPRGLCTRHTRQRPRYSSVRSNSFVRDALNRLRESIVPCNDPVITLGSADFLSSGIITRHSRFFILLLRVIDTRAAFRGLSLSEIFWELLITRLDRSFLPDGNSIVIIEDWGYIQLLFSLIQEE